MTLAIIQARLDSKRFPLKALVKLHGRTLVEHVYDRVCQVVGIDRVVVAVPAGDRDVFGDLFPFKVCAPDVPESDVLARFAAVSESWNADTIMRITADCVLWNPRIAEDVLKLYYADPHNEYASNVTEGYQDGTDVEVFSAAALRWASRAATDPYDKEHVTSWFRRHVKCAYLPAAVKGLPKTSVDTPEDLEFVMELLSQC